MKTIFLTKRLPTLLALIILFSSIWATSFLVKRGVITIGKASENHFPNNIKVVNITDSSFSVVFTTLDITKAVLHYGKTQELGTVIYDIRDVSSKQAGSYYSHMFTVNNLNPQTIYKFSLIAEEKTYLDNGQNYSTTTAPKLNIQPADYKPVTGKVILPNGQNSQDTLVSLATNNSQELASLTNDSGNFNIPVSSIRDQNLSQFNNISDKSILNIEIIKQDLKSSAKSYYNDGSIPQITLSQNYNYALSLQSSQQNPATTSSMLEVPALSLTPGKEIKILSPRENESLVDQRPSFQGSAQPDSKIKIRIESENIIQTEVTADSRGSWSFRPETSLVPGEHTIIVEAIDNLGIVKRISQTFVVYAQGTQVRESTPSAILITMTPSPTSIPTRIPTKTIALAFTPTPTIKPTLTPTPTKNPILTTTGTLTPTPFQVGIGGTLTPTSTITPISAIKMSPTQAQTLTSNLTAKPTLSLAQTGNPIPSTIIFSISILLIITGTILLFIV